MTDKSIFTFKKTYFVLAIILFLVELFIGIYVKDDFIRPYGGDFLVVILLYFLVRAFFNISVYRAAIYVLIFSFAVEFAQYFKIVEVLGLQDIKLARIIIGTSYAFEDLVAYFLGIVAVILGEYFIKGEKLSATPKHFSQ